MRHPGEADEEPLVGVEQDRDAVEVVADALRRGPVAAHRVDAPPEERELQEEPGEERREDEEEELHRQSDHLVALLVESAEGRPTAEVDELLRDSR